MKERERKREKRGRKRDEIERSCQRSATSFAGTILFAQTARNNDSFSHFSPLRFYTLKIPVNGTIELPEKYIAYIDLSKLSIRFQRKT